MRMGTSQRCVFFVCYGCLHERTLTQHTHATTHAQLQTHKYPHIQVTYRHIGKQAEAACTFPHPRHVSFSTLSCGHKSRTDKGSGAPWCCLGGTGWALFCWFSERNGQIHSVEKGNIVIPLKVGWLSHATPTHLITRTCPRTYSPGTSQTYAGKLPAKRVKRRFTLPTSCRYVAASLTVLCN